MRRFSLISSPLVAVLCCSGNCLWLGNLHAQEPVAAPDTPAIQPNNAKPDETKPNEPARLRLEAASIRYAGQVAILSAKPGEFVRVIGDNVNIRAQNVEINLAQRSLKATGKVELTRTILGTRSVFSPGRERARDIGGPDTARTALVGAQERNENITEVFRGENLIFNANTQIGQLDRAEVRLSNFNIESAKIEIGQRTYIARDVVLRIGGLSDEERKIYGTPPFSLRARLLQANLSAGGGGNFIARGAALYFKNTRILPVPLAIFPALTHFGPSRANRPFRVFPSVSLNSADGFFFSTSIEFPLQSLDRGITDAQGKSRAPKFDSNAYVDVGVSAKQGFRGGVSLENVSPIGLLAVRARTQDVITTQLTNTIQLDRLPEIQYESPTLPLFRTGKGLGLGVYGAANAGQYTEKLENVSNYRRRSSRTQAIIGLTTRIVDRDGFYADLVATANRYPTYGTHYNQTSFEVGYAGNLSRRVRGLFSYRHTQLSGVTPFRFDEVEIPRELRTTFDVQLTPRYILPFDLRYDLDRNSFRDEAFGLLRSYKTFAYGGVYQVARKELRLEFRSAF